MSQLHPPEFLLRTSRVGEGRRDGDPARRTDDDFGASSAGSVDHGHRAGVPAATPKTVRKYLERGLEPPIYGPRQVGRPSKLAPYLDYLRERIAVLRRTDVRRRRLPKPAKAAPVCHEVAFLQRPPRRPKR
jgi:hypothetical protein